MDSVRIGKRDIASVSIRDRSHAGLQAGLLIGLMIDMVLGMTVILIITQVEDGIVY